MDLYVYTEKFYYIQFQRVLSVLERHYCTLTAYNLYLSDTNKSWNYAPPPVVSLGEGSGEILGGYKREKNTWGDRNL